MKKLLLCLSLVLACGKQPTKHTEPEKPVLEQLGEHVEGVKQWAERCDGVAAKEGCSVGDAALFNGILCASGDDIACEAVKRSQGADGRWWRAPQRVDSGEQDSFSRDMALGVMLYLIKTGDVEAAQRWMSWLKANDNKLCKGASDGRCDMSNVLWGVVRVVWSYLGLTPPPEARLANIGDDTTIYLEAQFVPAGYQMHLVSVILLVRKLTNTWSDKLQAAVNLLIERQPDNEFFRLVAGDKDKAVELALQHIPKSKPERLFQHSFERDTANQAWLDSYGWEFIALYNFLIGAGQWEKLLNLNVSQNQQL